MYVGGVGAESTETSVVSATYETVISHGEIKLDISSQQSPSQRATQIPYRGSTVKLAVSTK